MSGQEEISIAVANEWGGPGPEVGISIRYAPGQRDEALDLLARFMVDVIIKSLGT